MCLHTKLPTTHHTTQCSSVTTLRSTLQKNIRMNCSPEFRSCSSASTTSTQQRRRAEIITSPAPSKNFISRTPSTLRLKLIRRQRVLLELWTIRLPAKETSSSCFRLHPCILHLSFLCSTHRSTPRLNLLQHLVRFKMTL